MLTDNNMIDAFTYLQEHFSVQDLNLSSSSVVFILESPHKEELRNGVPVAGSSGKMMTKTIFQRRISDPLGIMISSASQYVEYATSLSQIGLLNVSPIPLQASAYPEKVREQYDEFLSCLEKIRVNNSVNYQNKAWNVARDLVANSFKNRLAALNGRDITIIPCGRFALYHYRSTDSSEKGWKEIIGVPHPSRNQWYQEIEPLRIMKSCVSREIHVSN
jgi:hypothetical protein